MSTPPDDHLPARMRARGIVEDGEQRIGRAWFRSLTRYLDQVRPAVTPPDRPLDPGRVSDHTGFWTEQVDQEIQPVIGGVLAGAWRRVTGDGEPLTDSWTSTYLNEAGNRLKNIPDEVYALVVREIERGITEGTALAEVTKNVQRVLTSTGSDYWPNRAVTVARTETIGAVNAGVYRAAVLDAEQRGDVAPFKLWIATDDKRTRPSHDKADKQRTLMTEPFVVGGARLLFPGDPRGPANEVINCRCSMLPIILGETVDWTDREQP